MYKKCIKLHSGQHKCIKWHQTSLEAVFHYIKYIAGKVNRLLRSHTLFYRAETLVVMNKIDLIKEFHITPIYNIWN